MGCINTSPVIKIHPIGSLKKKLKKNLETEKGENLSYKDFAFFDDGINDTPHRILEKR